MRWLSFAPVVAFMSACMGLAVVPAKFSPARASEHPAADDERPRQRAYTILFSGLDLGRSSFVGSGFERVFAAPEGARRFLIMTTSGAGNERRRGRPQMAAYREQMSQSALVLGYRWPTGTGSLTLLGGFETDTRQKDTDRRARFRGGGRFQIDLWHHPDANSLVTATIVAGTARPSAWARASLGRAIADRLYVGPEATLHVEEGYLQWRLGAHLTGIRVWRLEGRMSAGFRSDSDTVNGAYWTFNVHIRF